MTPVECPQAEAVVAAVLAGEWPRGCGEDLQMHARHCVHCAEVAQVAVLLRGDYRAFSRDVRVPSAGQIWWRAAVRARMEAAQAAARPITWIQGVAGASAIGAAVAVLALAWPLLRGLADRATGLAAGVDSRALQLVAPLVAVFEFSLPLVLAVAGCVILLPLAVLYYALSDD
jgi:hypothetical protein